MILEIYQEHPEIVSIIENIENNIIPPHLNTDKLPHNKEHFFNFSKDMFLKKFFHLNCIYGKVSVEICQKIKNNIGNKKVLEVMSGRGWLAKGLREQGIEVIATDNYSWLDNTWETITDVERIEALDAIDKYQKDVDVLLISWPYMDNTAYQCLKRFSPKKDIIFIGELNGCTADKDFVKNFKINKMFNYNSWNCLHDNIYFGKNKKPQKKLNP